MRSDIKKVICEDARRGARTKTPRKKWYNSVRSHYFEDDEDLLDQLPSQVGIRKFVKFNFFEMRSFSENLGALKGFIQKNIGKPWDAVYSQICSKCSPSGTVLEQHVHTHIPDFILTKTKLIDGKVFAQMFPGLGSYVPLREERYYRRAMLYVDPTDGTIKKLKSFKSEPRQTSQKIWRKYCRIINGKKYIFFNGWFVITKIGDYSTDKSAFLADFSCPFFNKLDKYIQRNHPIDKFYARSYYLSDILNKKNYCYVASKRQLSSREIKKLGLEAPNV